MGQREWNRAMFSLIINSTLSHLVDRLMRIVREGEKEHEQKSYRNY